MGLSFGEIMVLAVIALVVIGPKDLPKLLRAAGRMIGQARRAISDVKRETGLDDVLRGDFRDLERLADHIEELGPYRGDAPPKLTPKGEPAGFRLREYPPLGADSASLLPEDADVYADVAPDAPELASAPTVLGSIDTVERDASARDAKAAS